MNSTKLSIGWIRPLATPYLHGYRPLAQRSGSLRGYWFLRPEGKRKHKPRMGPMGLEGSRTQLGFFAGYLVAPKGYAFLRPQPPECLVFAFVHPVGGAVHRRLVCGPDAPWRKTFTYIRWLTHRPPRFAYYENERAALVRHLSMRDWPAEKYEHFSRNFFVETLAWLVRSGLVRHLLAGP